MEPDFYNLLLYMEDTLLFAPLGTPENLKVLLLGKPLEQDHLELSCRPRWVLLGVNSLVGLIAGIFPRKVRNKIALSFLGR